MKERTILLGFLFLVLLLSPAMSFGVETSEKVEVFILTGQSNMEGKAKIELLEYQINQPGTRNFFKHLKKDGQWDVRKDLNVPNLPFVIGQMEQGGPEGANKRMQPIKDAQASMETTPEFKGNVKVVKTDVFWDRKAAALVENWRDHRAWFGHLSDSKS